MTVLEFEQKIFDLEGVRLIVRAAANEQIGEYDYKKSYPKGNSIREWLDSRIWNLVGDFDVVVVDGSGATPNRKTHMSTLRDSYNWE